MRSAHGTQAAATGRLLLAATLTAVGAGLGGMALALLLHAIQHLAYHYSLAHVVSHQSFLSGVERATPLRRLMVALCAGVVAGVGWFAVYRFGRPLVSIKRAVDEGAPMPPGATLAHALLQIVTVALGSPLGREVAPREIGALVGGRLSLLFALPVAQRRWIVAAGAGAGLAAVYGVPLAGAVFTLEVLLGTFHPAAAALALFMSTLAAQTASLGLGTNVQYAVPTLAPGHWLSVWAVLFGPIFGMAGAAFSRATAAARSRAPRGAWLLWLCLLNFAALGLLSIRFPELLGNGKGPVQLGFEGELTPALACALLALKMGVICASLRAGAAGGLLTPGLACGALLAVAGGALWNIALPGISPGACAIVGGAAFLAASMRMPLTAIVLVAEFTHLPYALAPPLLLAVAGAVWAQKLCADHARAPLRAAR
ncbi:chloride channel protein [Cupriavidus sp.]|uniref:chloride channel protein n=1 Tax=Cupriavidus sp. TaxID=1873897 RepID=UPI0028BEB94E|nr:chloride channel protein [Cupriavidus sp.]